MKNTFQFTLLLLFSGLFYSLNAQEIKTDSTGTAADSIKEYYQWYHADIDENGLVGISLNQAYEFARAHNKVAKPVIVAIIDSGVDTAHIDLRNRLWHNPKEIPYNGIDDDGDGYVDDIYGWNFIGGADGKNVDGDTWELTRLYRMYKKKFAGKSKDDIAPEDKAQYEEWLKVQADYKKQRDESREAVKNYKMYIEAIEKSNEILDKYFRGAKYTKEDVENIHTTNDRLKWAINIYSFFEGDPKPIKDALEYHEELLFKKLNPRFHTRQIVGDNVLDINDTLYGNNDVTAGTASHGTGVAGIVAAERNGFGVDGIVDSVQIMIIRVVPGGDERDKDVSLAIRYAVNHGARIINCSFGKSYSPNKEFVDSAIRYAERNNVLIIHAAGNSAENNDVVAHYPTPEYAPGKFVRNWLDVGASDSLLNIHLPADFSNYGHKTVDLFAPGVKTMTTVPKNKFRASSGTSNASPVVTGVAALVLSYYPQLTAVELKEIIKESARAYPKQKVLIPGEKKKKTKFKKLSNTAGVVNAYEAMKLAEERTSK
jgi:subtilisin family serine protease